MIGVAAMTFFSHVHRMATRPVEMPATPASPRLIFPPQFHTSPAPPAPMRGVSRSIPDDAIDSPFMPPSVAPPVIVRPGPPRRGWERASSPDGRRDYRGGGWEDRAGERERDR
jgi:hypothetical protein